MSLTTFDTERVALLARLKLTPAQSAEMAQQLTSILSYIDQLSEVATDGGESGTMSAENEELRGPRATASLSTSDPSARVSRLDEPLGSLDREAALGNAPKRDAEHFLVPAVLGE